MSDWQDVCAALALLSAAALFGWLDWRIFAFYRAVFLDEYSSAEAPPPAALMDAAPPIDAEPDCEIYKSVNAPSPDDEDATRSGLRRRGKAAPLCRSSSPH